jgi:hypothetical protein
LVSFETTASVTFSEVKWIFSSACQDNRNRQDPMFAPVLDDEEIRRERAVARALRSTAWWRRKTARGLCHYCGGRFSPRELTMDHLIPLIRGGRSIKANLVPCCKPCNQQKSHLLPMEWEPSPSKPAPSKPDEGATPRDET